MTRQLVGVSLIGQRGQPRPTVADLWDELRRGGLAEATLLNGKFHLDGACIGGAICFVDPRPSYVLSCLHELLHRMHPRWREKRIDHESRRLLSEMSAADVTRFYRSAKRRARKFPKPVTIEISPE